MVSVGRPSGALIQMVLPVALSNEMKRCAPPACCPQRNVRPLTISWLPSITGDDTRPPCVVHIPNSSAQRALPEQLAVGRERHQQAVAAEREDVAGRRVHRGRGPGDPMRRDVAREQVVLVLPQQLAGVGVEAHQPFLHGGAGAGGVLQIEAVAEHDRRRPAAVRDLPRQVLAGRRPRRSAGRFRSRPRSAPGRATRASPPRAARRRPEPAEPG